MAQAQPPLTAAAVSELVPAATPHTNRSEPAWWADDADARAAAHEAGHLLAAYALGVPAVDTTLSRSGVRGSIAS